MAKKQYNVKTSAVAATERRARKYGVAGGSVGAGGYIDVAGDVAGKLDRDVFESMFERVVTGTDDEGNETWYILAKAALVSVGDMTAYGYGGTSGDTPSPGVTELRCLDDVILDNPEAGQILKYDGSHWVNGTTDAGLDEAALAAYLQTNRYAKLSDIPSLADYATRSWVEGKSYATQSWVEDKGYATETWVIAQRYLTQHQDISHLLTRAEFDDLFERVENEDGTWFIKAKSHLAVMGDVTAYFADGAPGGGYVTSLADLTDVELGSLVAGDTIKWNGQKWVNSQGGGGLDESQLAAYLTANNYVTEADLGDYVTIGTDQTISGKKTFGACETFFTRRATINGDFSGPENCPHIMWYVPNQEYTKMLMDVYGNLHLLWGGATDLNNYRGLTVSSIAKYGGTSSQFLKADGSVDGNNYIKCYDGNVKLEWLWGSNPTHIVGFESNSSTAMRVYDGNALRNFTNAVNKAGDTMTGLLKVPSIELTTISGIKFTNNILGGGGDVAMMYITGTGEAQQLTFEVQNDADDIINFITPDNNGLKKNGNTIWHAGNDGSGSGLDADLLDGLHESSFYRSRGGLNAQINNGYAGIPFTNGSYFLSAEFPNWYGACHVFVANGSNCAIALLQRGNSLTQPELLLNLDGNPARWYNQGHIVTTGWGTALSASKLHTARTLYVTSYNSYRSGDGVAFDGTGDVTLKLPNSITASDWFRSYGATGWYNESYGGGIYMEDATWVRVFNNKGFYSGSGEIRSDARFNRMGQYGAMWNNGAGAYNVAIYNNANQTPLLNAYRDSAGPESTGANRLFAMELLNSGTQLNFGFGGAAKFYFYSGGTFVANGEITAYSDARGKQFIRPLENRGGLRPVTYVKDGKQCIGFVAQEALGLYPELVHDDGTAKHWLSFNYMQYTAVLQVQIDDHEARIKRLEERR